MLDFFFNHIFVPLGICLFVALCAAWFFKAVGVLDVQAMMLVVFTIIVAPYGLLALFVWALSESGL